jgi:DNA-binding transcriptional ArsR family regulator
MQKNMTLPQVSEKIGELLQVVAPSARLAILIAIGTGEACVCHLETALGWRQAYISQHLMALRQAGLLDSRREGKYIFYRIVKPDIIQLIQQAAQIAGVVLPHIEIVAPEQQCGCPTCAPASE